MAKIKPKLYKHNYDPYVISSRGEKNREHKIQIVELCCRQW